MSLSLIIGDRHLAVQSPAVFLADFKGVLSARAYRLNCSCCKTSKKLFGLLKLE
ncbi:MAG: hypothetical protein KME31_37015 [Tolypothrix carrinoi HA7290-LM1]|nr:hypothetical protein [Tolypothrix carrinoi HA7290-LM1]